MPEKSMSSAWVNAQVTPKLREIANQILQNARLISTGEYLEQVNLMICDFAKQLRDKRYVLLLTQPEETGGLKQILDTLKEAKIRQPEAVLSLETISDHLAKHSKVKRILLVHAPAFNARLVRRSLEVLHSVMTRSDMTLWFGIPYMTEAVKRCFSRRIILTHQRVLALPEILDDGSIRYAKRFGLSGFTESTVLTYFEDFETNAAFRASREGEVFWGLTAQMLFEDFLTLHNLPLTTELSPEHEEDFDDFVMKASYMEVQGMFFLNPTQMVSPVVTLNSEEKVDLEEEPKIIEEPADEVSSICRFM